MITHLYIYIYPSQRIFILELYVYQDNIRTLVHFVTFKFLLFHILLIEIICMDVIDSVSSIMLSMLSVNILIICSLTLPG